MEHTLTFGCQHARGSSAEADFLSATAERRVLPIVLVIDSIASLAHFTSSQSLGSSAVASNRQLGNRPALRACLPRSVGQLLSVISSVSYQSLCPLWFVRLGLRIFQDSDYFNGQQHRSFKNDARFLLRTCCVGTRDRTDHGRGTMPRSVQSDASGAPARGARRPPPRHPPRRLSVQTYRRPGSRRWH